METIKLKVNTLNLDWFNKRVETYNKKAKRLKLEPLQVVEGGAEKSYKTINGRKFATEFKNIEILNSNILVFDEYEIICKLDHTNNFSSKANVTFFNGYQGDVTELENKSSYCQHCNTKRKRNNTYLVRNKKNGEIKQVARTCLKEYVSVYNIESILKLYDLLIDIEEQKDIPYVGEAVFNWYYVEDLLIYIRNHINKYGYISRKEAEENFSSSTADYIKNMIIGNSEIIYRIEKEDKDKCKEQVKKDIDFFLNFNWDLIEKTQYHIDLETALLNEFSLLKNIGLLTSFFITVKILRDKVINKESIENGKFIGAIKDRIESDVTLVSINTFYRSYNSFSQNLNYIYTFKDKDSNVLVWFSGTDLGIEEGTQITIKGTIKEHKEFNKTKQTILTRCKVA